MTARLPGWARNTALALLAPAITVVFALVLTGIILTLSGHSATHAYQQMFDFAKTASTVINVLNEACSYFFVGLAVAIGFRMALFNIGAEGQYRLAALLAAAGGAALHVWPPLQVLLIMLIAAGTGGVLAGVAGTLKVTRGVSEVISTIMLNFIALALVDYLLGGPLRAVASSDNSQATAALPRSGRFPALDKPLKALGFSIPDGSTVTGLLLVAIVLGVGMSLLLSRTRFGFSLRATGVNPTAALAAGINAKTMVVKTMLISGALAGLAGLPILMSQAPFRYDSTFAQGFGFTGVAVALVGRNRPFGIAVAAVLFAFLDQSSAVLELNNIPKEIADMMQGIIVLTVVVAYEIVRRYNVRTQERAASRALAAGAVA